MAQINEKDVLRVIQDALNTDSKLTLDSTSEDVEEWDSLGHLGILAALDKLFGGKTGDIREMGNARSVQEILQILRDNSLI